MLGIVGKCWVMLKSVDERLGVFGSVRSVISIPSCNNHEISVYSLMGGVIQE